MSLTVPVIVSWDLDTVIGQVDNLRSDESWFLDSATAVRGAADQNLDGFHGDTASAATRGSSALTRDITILARKAASAAEALAVFCQRAPGLRAELMSALDDAAAARCRVADDGTVQGPLLIGDPSDPNVVSAHEKNAAVASEIETRIQPLLRQLEHLDLTAANALNLMSMTESYVSYPYDPDPVGIDLRTIAASGTISLSLDTLGSAAEAMDAASKVTRGLPVFGTALGLALGVATRPEHESLGETLAIEGAGVATSALTGAAAGSVVPGAGTAAGFIIGALLGTATTIGLRHHIAVERADGKKGFGW